MKNCGALIRETPRLLDSFRSLHYDAAFIITDRDKIAHDNTRCPGPVIAQFGEEIQREARRPKSERYLSICVAIRGMEAWFLADANAIRSVLPKVAYEAPDKTDGIDAGDQIKGLWRNQHGNIAFNKIDFAEKISAPFDPEIAKEHSDSFAYFWQRISETCLATTWEGAESSESDEA
ncbi:MAG: hypothetical protein JWN14_3490 [Chthonomonadales bacterium]|nr:hypothetical protein [Chthonomonadales bacterium]